MGEPLQGARSPGRCWDCGSPLLHLVSGADRARFRCASCSACWVVEDGVVRRVAADDAAPRAELRLPAR